MVCYKLDIQRGSVPGIGAQGSRLSRLQRSSTGAQHVIAESGLLSGCAQYVAADPMGRTEWRESAAM